jgi:hypothetical protein
MESRRFSMGSSVVVMKETYRSAVSWVRVMTYVASSYRACFCHSALMASIQRSYRPGGGMKTHP